MFFDKFENFGDFNKRAFLVGGAVRDKFMNLEPHDFDYVVESHESAFMTKFPNLERVGNNFPVFLMNGNEVALTRTETCNGNNYQDFDCVSGVSIQEDLGRRDFTINSIAINVATGNVVDPHNGIDDIKAGIIRSCNKIAFMDDPLRILRGLRFACRFNFSIEDHTFEMMKKSVHRLADINPERVVLELKKLWNETDDVSRFFKMLAELKGLYIHFNPLNNLRFVPAGPFKFHGNNSAFDHSMNVIDKAKENGLNFDCFIACLMHDTGKGTTDPSLLPKHHQHESRSLKINKEWLDHNRFDKRTNELTLCVAINHMKMHCITKMRPIKLVRFVKSINKNLFEDFISCCNCDHKLSEEQLIIIEKLRIVNDHKLTDEQISQMNNSKNKKDTFERILTKIFNSL